MSFAGPRVLPISGLHLKAREKTDSRELYAAKEFPNSASQGLFGLGCVGCMSVALASTWHLTVESAKLIARGVELSFVTFLPNSLQLII